MDRRSNIGTNPACVIFGGISLLRAFTRTAVKCHVVAESRADLTRYSRARETFTVVPSLTEKPDEVLGILTALAGRFESKPVLYYGKDTIMRFVSNYRDELSEHYRFLMPSQDVLDTCSEKGRFSARAGDLDVSYPRSLIAKNGIDETALEEMNPPLVIKPDVTSDVRKIAALVGYRTQKALFARSRKHAMQVAEPLLREGVELIIQEWVPGDESLIFSYHAFNGADFLPLGAFAGQKLRTYPDFGGRSTRVTLVRDDELLATGRETARQLEIPGPVKLDFKRSADSGELFLMEANPRFTLWNHVGAECGINLLLVAYQYLAGLPVDRASGYRTDRHWITFADDVRAHVASRSGRWSSILAYPFFRNKPVFHTFAWNDPLPSLIAMKRQLAKRR